MEGRKGARGVLGEGQGKEERRKWPIGRDGTAEGRGGGARGHGAHHMPTFSPLANNQLIESVCAQGTGPAKMSASLAL
jgi:hypothetical protein